jgi:RND family efflux transporter MFP subunit
MGRVTQIVKPEGSIVQEGDTILYALNDIPGMDYKPGPVLSPISGTVGKIYVEVGQMITQATPVATVASYANNVKVKAPVSDQDLIYVKKGAKAEITVSAIPDKVFEGKVTNISTVLDQITRSATVEITIPNKDMKLIPGMACDIKLMLEQKDNVVAMPVGALFTTGEPRVVVMDNNNIVHFRNIKVGLIGDELAEVISGLNVGEKVVTVGKERVSDGEQVRPIEVGTK